MKSTKPKAGRKPSEAQYRRALIALAIGYAPEIYPCHHCGWPVIHGYCCQICGSVNPSGSDA